MTDEKRSFGAMPPFPGALEMATLKNENNRLRARIAELEAALSFYGEGCFACRIEAAIGTEEDPHPVWPKYHSCTPLVPAGAKR